MLCKGMAPPASLRAADPLVPHPRGIMTIHDYDYYDYSKKEEGMGYILVSCWLKSRAVLTSPRSQVDLSTS